MNDTRESPSLKIFNALEKYNNIIDFHDNKISKIKLMGKIHYSKPQNLLKI